jgi:glycosyltransferase involved in cell wall biosynthesis
MADAGRPAAVALSVVVPCFNAAATLDEAVRSILAQGFDEPYEIVIVDDRSTDPATLARLAELAARHREVRVVRNEGRKGPAAARNRGLAAAGGRWIGFLDADDRWAEGGLLPSWRAIAADPAIAWICANRAIWFPDGRLEPVAPSLVAEAARRGACPEAPYVPADPLPSLISVLQFQLGSVLVRKDVIVSVGGFDEDLIHGEDWYLLLRLGVAARLHVLPHVMVWYRRHAASVMSSSMNLAEDSIRSFYIAHRDPVLKAYRKQLRWALVVRLRQLARTNILGRHLARGLGYGLRATVRDPLDLRAAWYLLRLLTAQDPARRLRFADLYVRPLAREATYLASTG